MARTAKQIAASKRNLAKARAARSRKAGGSRSNVSKGNFGGPKSTEAWNKKQESLAPSTLLRKYNKSLAGLRVAKSPAAKKQLEEKADVFWSAYQKAQKRSKVSSKEHPSVSGNAPGRRNKTVTDSASADAFIKKMGDMQRAATIKAGISAKRKKYGPSPAKGGGPKRISQKMKFGGTYFVPGMGVKAFSARPRLKSSRVR